jgi:hypothetical protein
LHCSAMADVTDQRHDTSCRWRLAVKSAELVMIACAAAGRGGG